MVLMFIRWSSGQRADMQYIRGVVQCLLWNTILYADGCESQKTREGKCLFLILSISHYEPVMQHAKQLTSAHTIFAK
jgi:hypothetical protein